MDAPRAGAWLFARRGWLPVPLVAIALLFPPRGWMLGLPLMALGEAVRLWAVGHIGLPSRTRAPGVGPLVTSGPYAWSRNPLYVGNILLWSGLGVVSWPAVLAFAPLMALYYSLIVTWEEQQILATVGEPYRVFCARVPRWLGWPRAEGEPTGWDARRAFRTERGTFVVLVVVLSLVALRAMLPTSL